MTLAPTGRARALLAGHAVLTVVVVAALLVALVAEGYGASFAPAISVVGALAGLLLLALHRAAVDRRRLAAPGSRAKHLATAAAALGAGAGCWLVWLALPQAVGVAWTTGAPELPGPASALAGAALSAVVVALVLAALTGSILAPLGAGAGLWLAHTMWLLGRDSALWAFAAALALPVAVAVVFVSLGLASGAGLVDEGPPQEQTEPGGAGRAR